MQEVNPAAIEREITNRVEPFNTLHTLLIEETPIDVMAFYAEVKKNTLMTSLNRFRSTTFNGFFDDEPFARHLITRLARKLPQSDHAAITIDATMEEAILRTNLQNSQAALLFSLVLTIAHPNRFVDYPAHSHWEAFAKRLGYGIPRTTAHGNRLVWASAFAGKIAQTNVYQERWPSDQPPFQYPMWIVAAMNWANRELERSQ